MQKNIEYTCRVCLKQSTPMVSLFVEMEDLQLRICDLLESVGDLKVSPQDIYPKFICYECTKELLVTVKFRKKCKQTQIILSQFVSEEIYEEDDEPETKGKIQDENIVLKEFAGESNLKQKTTTVEEAGEETNGPLTIQEQEISNTEHSEDFNIEDSEKYEYCYIMSDEELEDCIELDTHEKDKDMLLMNVEKEKGKSRQSKSYRANYKTTPQKINCNCDACGAGFTYLANLRKHLESHCFTEIYECAVCLWPFKYYSKLEEHCIEQHPHLIKEIENSEKDAEVKIGEEYSNEMENVTENPNTLVLLVTKNEENGSKKSFKCHSCSKKFFSKSSLDCHVRVHTGDRPFECTECNKSFRTKGALDLHSRRHSGLRPYACPSCDKCFTESSNLKVHMRIHTGERPHKCTICEKKFSRVFLLKIHQRTHTGERPYECPVCRKSFAQLCDLSAHKRTHTDERPYKCPLCGKGFIKKGALNIHSRKHDRLRKKNVQQDETAYISMDEESSQLNDEREDVNHSNSSNLYLIEDSNTEIL